MGPLPNPIPFITNQNHGPQMREGKSRDLGESQSVPKNPSEERESPDLQPGVPPCPQLERVEGLTSKISLLALGDVFSLNTLMATGIFTFSPSGIQMPCAERRM